MDFCEVRYKIPIGVYPCTSHTQYVYMLKMAYNDSFEDSLEGVICDNWDVQLMENFTRTRLTLLIGLALIN